MFLLSDVDGVGRGGRVWLHSEGSARKVYYVGYLEQGSGVSSWIKSPLGKHQATNSSLSRESAFACFPSSGFSKGHEDPTSLLLLR
jgi:hypothetical protein